VMCTMKPTSGVPAAWRFRAVIIVAFASVLASCSRPAEREGESYAFGESAKAADEDKIFFNDAGMGVVVNHALVMFKTRPSRQEVERLARSVGGKVVGQIPSLKHYQLEVPSRSLEELRPILKKLGADGRVDSVGLNVVGGGGHEHCVGSPAARPR